MAGVIPQRCATRSRPSSMQHPSKRNSDALGERTTINPLPVQDGAVTQGEQSTSSPSLPTPCGHPQPCAPIPGTVGASPTLWIPVLMECRHVMPCAAQEPPSARPSNWRTGCNHAHVLGELPSKSLPGEYKASTTSARTRIHQDALGSQALCIGTTTLCKNPCGMPVSRIPLVYKRRRRTPGCRGATFIRILPRTITPLILALASII
jgi:hypothetical protein